MLLILVIALVLASAAVVLVARAALFPRIRAGENVGRIAGYGYATAPVEAESERVAVLPQIARRLGDRFARGASSDRHEQMRKLLLSAGAWSTTSATLLGYRVLGTLFFGGLAVWTSASSGWSGVIAVVFAVYGAALGWLGPLLFLRARARRRLERIELELPELIDLIVVTLEAGVGFNAALQRASERMTGPLGDEIRLTLREHTLGLGMDGALTNLLDRCDVPAVRAFVRSVLQSESLGVSIGQVMRDLSHDMRVRRRQIIEEKAQKAPIKMLFPLAFLILPALLLIVLFPGLYNITQTLGGT
jgi:tight adherence protein C